MKNPGHDAVAEQASVWLARRDRGLSGAEQDAMFEWLAADPRHAAEWARLNHAWSELDQLAQWRPEHGERPNPDLLAPAPARIAPWERLAVAAGLAAALALAAVSWSVLRWSEDDRRVQETVATVSPAVPASAPEVRPNLPTFARGYDRSLLDDGSVIELNGDAAVEVRFSRHERRVWLLRGEAHFSVARDPSRPFIVRAGSVDIRAVGTAFNVVIAPTTVEVLVTEGRVQVTPPRPADGTPVAVPEAIAGQRVRVALVEPGRPPEVITATASEMAAALAWQPKQLEFSAAPLLAVVEEFNRTGLLRIEIADPTLADLRVGASFRSDNVEGFLRLLEASFDVTVERLPDRAILRRAPEPAAPAAEFP